MARVTLDAPWFAPGAIYFFATEPGTWVEVPDEFATPEFLPPGGVNLDAVDDGPAPSAELLADQKAEAEAAVADQAQALISRRRKVAGSEG